MTLQGNLGCATDSLNSVVRPKSETCSQVERQNSRRLATSGCFGVCVDGLQLQQGAGAD